MEKQFYANGQSVVLIIDYQLNETSARMRRRWNNEQEPSIHYAHTLYVTSILWINLWIYGVYAHFVF